MKVFITGTDTNVGKTIVAAWLALHTKSSYWKPIQTGSLEDSDTETVKNLARCPSYPEIYSFHPPLSPHLAAYHHHQEIDLKAFKIPECSSLVIEGAGGLMVPLNTSALMIDLIQAFKIPVLLVARSTLGTINHTCLSLEALKNRDIPVLGVIMNGIPHPENRLVIEKYGQTKVLAELPFLSDLTFDSLQQHPLPLDLKYRLKGLTLCLYPPVINS